MPIPLNLIRQLHDALELIKQGEKAESAAILNSIYNSLDKIWDALYGIESMEMLGMLARGFQELNQTEKEIRILEKLCTLADNDLNRLALLATDNDIISTGMDFVSLGIAYNRVSRKEDARKTLIKAKKILEEIEWVVEVEDIINGKKTFIGPKSK